MSTTLTPPPAVAERRLRAVLGLDAAGTAVFGLAATLAAVPLASLLGTTAPILVSLGVFLIVVAAGLTVLAARPTVPGPGVLTAVVVNATWALASVAVALLVDLTVLGVVVVGAQAVVVAVFAELQYLAWRRIDRRARTA